MPPLPIPRQGAKISVLHPSPVDVPLLIVAETIQGQKCVLLPNRHDDEFPDVIRCGPNCGQAYSVSHSVDNWARGLCKRVIHDYHPFNPNVQADFISFARHYIKNHIQPLKEGLDEDELLENWLGQSKYDSDRRNKLRELNKMMRNHQIPRRQYLQLTSFIKSEFYTEPKEARIINSRSDAFKSRVGPYIHAAEAMVYDDHFIKHCKPSEVVEKMKNKACGFEVFYETDYSSFEGSFKPEYLRQIELYLLTRLFYNYPEIVSLCTLALVSSNKLIYRKRYSAEFPGSRMSGEMWTSMCNGYMNKLLVEFVAKRSDALVDYLVEGDDGFICSNKPLNWELTADAGFKLKCDIVHDPMDVQFCSLRVCENKLIPNIERTLTHYGFIIDTQIARGLAVKSKRSQKKLDEVQYAKACSLLATSSGIPILQAVALQQLRVLSGTHLNPKYFDWWEREFYDLSNPAPSSISLGVRKYVEKEFGILVDDQIEVERQILNCPFRCYDILLPAR